MKKWHSSKQRNKNWYPSRLQKRRQLPTGIWGSRAPANVLLSAFKPHYLAAGKR